MSIFRKVRSMLLLEIALVVLFLLVLVVQIMFFPEYYQISLAAVTAVALYYLIFGFIIFSNLQWHLLVNEKGYDRVSYVSMLLGAVVGFFVSVGVFGIVFFIEMYAGANWMLLLALTVTGSALLVIAIARFKNYIEDDFFKESSIRLFIATTIFSILYFTSQERVFDYLWENYNEYAQFVIENNEEIKAKYKEQAPQSID